MRPPSGWASPSRAGQPPRLGHSNRPFSGRASAPLGPIAAAATGPLPFAVAARSEAPHPFAVAFRRYALPELSPPSRVSAPPPTLPSSPSGLLPRPPPSEPPTSGPPRSPPPLNFLPLPSAATRRAGLPPQSPRHSPGRALAFRLHLSPLNHPPEPSWLRAPRWSPPRLPPPFAGAHTPRPPLGLPRQCFAPTCALGRVLETRAPAS
ncbi:pollen-specific leucine-rich repeat extensin-like protein 3 [Iris pallida]|uniref:Pollen-specific leucine-rich repeat extensin-like protein 3 n=1 Tax=Iris pallida TaxID=29817 RepID=A0AAX6HY70_IRIPA|nr:pollen-specific leucine-rich repeat extensin-like protein 3 [Iris pallida]